MKDDRVEEGLKDQTQDKFDGSSLVPGLQAVDGRDDFGVRDKVRSVLLQQGGRK